MSPQSSLPPSLSPSLAVFTSWLGTLPLRATPPLCISVTQPHALRWTQSMCEEGCCLLWMLFKCVLTHSAATVTLITVCAPANRPSWIATCSAEPRGKPERENYLALACNCDSSECAAWIWLFGWIGDFVVFGDDDDDDDALWLFTLMSSSLGLVHGGMTACVLQVCLHVWTHEVLSFCWRSDRPIYWSGWLTGHSLYSLYYYFEIIGVGQ